MMSTTRGNELSGTPIGWLKATGRIFAIAITGLTFALGGALGSADTAQAQAEPQAGNSCRTSRCRPWRATV